MCYFFVLFDRDIIVNLYLLHFSSSHFSSRPNKRVFHSSTFPSLQPNTHEGKLNIFYHPIIFYHFTFPPLQPNGKANSVKWGRKNSRLCPTFFFIGRLCPTYNIKKIKTLEHPHQLVDTHLKYKKCSNLHILPQNPSTSVHVKMSKYTWCLAKWTVTVHIYTVTVHRVNNFLILFALLCQTTSLPQPLQQPSTPE